MPAQYVEANRSDYIDAEAIAETVQRHSLGGRLVQERKVPSSRSGLST